MHEKYHRELDQILPRQAGKAFYDSLKGAEKKAMLKKLAKFTKAFDRQNGTKLYKAMLENGFPKDL